MAAFNTLVITAVYCLSLLGSTFVLSDGPGEEGPAGAVHLGGNPAKSLHLGGKGPIEVKQTLKFLYWYVVYLSGELLIECD